MAARGSAFVAASDLRAGHRFAMGLGERGGQERRPRHHQGEDDVAIKIDWAAMVERMEKPHDVFAVHHLQALFGAGARGRDRERHVVDRQSERNRNQRFPIEEPSVALDEPSDSAKHGAARKPPSQFRPSVRQARVHPEHHQRQHVAEQALGERRRRHHQPESNHPPSVLALLIAQEKRERRQFSSDGFDVGRRVT